MANRHLSRSIAIQILFEWDFHDRDSSRIDEITKRNIREFAPGIDDDKFIKELISGVLKKEKKINSIIEKAAPEWPLDQIAMIDRNVLRVGLYELLFGSRDEVPPKVAINEAIELAKTFGGDSSGKFVNGVLGTVYREIGEPGKDDTGKKRKEPDLKNIPEEVLAGAVVFRKDNGNIFYALVHDVFGYWTLSKGHVEDNGNKKDGAAREIKEELGIKNLNIGEELGTNEYIASDPEKGPIRKKVTYFIAETIEKDLSLESGGGLDDASWFQYDEIKELRMYDDIKLLLKKANNILTSQ